LGTERKKKGGQILSWFCFSSRGLASNQNGPRKKREKGKKTLHYAIAQSQEEERKTGIDLSALTVCAGKVGVSEEEQMESGLILLAEGGKKRR